MASKLTTDHLKQIIETQAMLALAGFDLQNFMDTVVDRMQVLTQATGAVVELVEGDHMVYKAASGTVAPYIGLRLNMANSLTGLCVRDNEIKISNDTSCDPRVDAEACKRVSATSMVVVPLHRGSDAVGVLKVVSEKTNAFDSDDIATLQLMAGLLGGALGQQLEIEQRNRLEDALLQRTQELEERHQQLTDVLTELHEKSEQLVLKNQQALEASRLKSEFLANMSHEIRTPMNAVVGFTDILLRANLGDKHREYLNCIRDAGRGLIALIGDILDLSKIEAGKLIIEYIDFEPLQLVEGTAQLLVAPSMNKGLSLYTYIDPQIPAVVLGDPSRVRQILINLIGNAIKFSDQGSIAVRVTVDQQTDNESVTVKFTITDQGVGLTEAEMQKLFQPFVQADGSTTRKFGGTGLGLSICKRLVELMGGQIGVNSTKEKGSTFWFTLPFQCRPGKAQTSGNTTPAHQKLQRKNVLTVDDDPVAREIIGAYLESWGMTHTEVATSSEALDALRNSMTAKPFDVVITDLVMPDVDGIDLARMIQSDPTIGNVPLLVMVTATSAEYGEEALKEGFQGFLSKPIKKSQLLDCLTGILHKRNGQQRASGGFDAVHGKARASGRFTTFDTKPRTSGAFSAIDPRLGASGAFPAVEAKRARRVLPHGLILLAEDHPANQMVAELQLNELGLTTHIVNNGLEAVEAVRSNQYLAIFMDCQMPEMDGFEATREIRNQETLTGRHVPIIAMTAHAMEGDRETCLAAGMDAYITKPVELEELHKVLAEFLPTAEATYEAATQAEQPSCGGPNQTAIDIAGLVGIFGKKSVRKLIKVFLDDTEKSLETMRQSVDNRDVSSIRELAHKIKGACATIRAETLSALNAQLEIDALAQDWRSINRLRGQIEDAYALVKQESESFLSDESI